MTRRIAAVLIALVLLPLRPVADSPCRLVSQERLNVFGSVGGSFMASTGSFTNINGIPAPGPLDFTASGTSFQPWLYLGADMQFYDGLRVGGRLGISGYAFGYQANERVPIATPDGGTRLATLGHNLDVGLTGISIEPYARYSHSAGQFAVDFGIPFTFTAVDDYSQTQRFTDPSDLQFVDGSVEQVTGEGAVPNVSTIVPGLTAGLEAMFPLDEDASLMLTPRFQIGYQIGSFHQSAPMRAFSVGLGLGVRYDPEASPSGPYRDTTFVRDTIMILSSNVTTRTTELANATGEEYPGVDTIRVVMHESYRTLIPKPPAVLEASLRLAFEAKDGTVTEQANVDVTIVERERTVPILPVVVFDALEGDIPAAVCEVDTRHGVGLAGGDCTVREGSSLAVPCVERCWFTIA